MTIETANRLYELRKKHNLSQEELAEKLGVSRQAVSKWERSEASPDTDNLIALAKIYGLSLDELIYGEKEKSEEKNENKAENKSDESSQEEQTEDDVLIDIKEDDGDRVIISPKGILVEEKDGKKVNISLKGIKIETVDDNDEDGEDEVDEDNNAKERVYVSGDGKAKIKIKIDKSDFQGLNFWRNVPYPIICGILYLVFGFAGTCGGWGKAWILFLTIPVYYSIVEAILRRKISEFEYPVFVLCVFFYLGLYLGIWHPSWLMFLTIPVFEFIASVVDSGIRRVK